MSWRCWLGHDWVRIGSAPATITIRDRRTLVWEGTSLVPLTYTRSGFVILVECRHCGAEKGYVEDAGGMERRTAAFARSFIESANGGHLRKGDAV